MQTPFQIAPHSYFQIRRILRSPSPLSLTSESDNQPKTTGPPSDIITRVSETCPISGRGINTNFWRVLTNANNTCASVRLSPKNTNFFILSLSHPTDIFSSFQNAPERQRRLSVGSQSDSTAITLVASRQKKKRKKKSENSKNQNIRGEIFYPVIAVVDTKERKSATRDAHSKREMHHVAPSVNKAARFSPTRFNRAFTLLLRFPPLRRLQEPLPDVFW